MSRKDFLNKLHIKNSIYTFNANLANFIEMLSEKYPDCSISLEKIERKDSNKKDDFISIRLNNVKNPIHFRIPVKKIDLSVYQSSEEYDTLNYRYDVYNSLYKDKIIDQFIAERKYLSDCFPNVVFNTKIRQKSKFSYEDKILGRMINNKYLDKSSQKTCLIKDIIAGRHIISSIDGHTEPEILNALCFKFEQALKIFRKTDQGSKFGIVLEKDYITNPKENGYQSIHLINESLENSDCTYETQIRTFDMEEQSKTDEKIAHDSYKPRIIDQYAPLRVPIYTSVTPFNDDKGNPLVVTPPPEESFYHFYGIPFTDYMNQLNPIIPIINDIKTNLYSKQKLNTQKEIK